jgi:hypothetical protein
VLAGVGVKEIKSQLLVVRDFGISQTGNQKTKKTDQVAKFFHYALSFLSQILQFFDITIFNIKI